MSSPTEAFNKAKDKMIKEDYLLLRDEVLRFVAHRLQYEEGDFDPAKHSKKYFRKVKQSHVPPTQRRDSAFLGELAKEWQTLGGLTKEEARDHCTFVFRNRKLFGFHEYFRMIGVVNDEKESKKAPKKVLVLCETFILVLTQYHALIAELQLCNLKRAYMPALATLVLSFADGQGNATRVKIIRCGNLDLVQQRFRKYAHEAQKATEDSGPKTRKRAQTLVPSSPKSSAETTGGGTKALGIANHSAEHTVGTRRKKEKKGKKKRKPKPQERHGKGKQEADTGA